MVGARARVEVAVDRRACGCEAIGVHAACRIAQRRRRRGLR